MNLIEIRKRDRQNKIICIIVCFLLVFTVFANTSINSYAFAPAVFLVPAVAVMAILTAYGISANDGTVDSLGELAQAVYGDMTGDIKSLIDYKASNASLVAHMFGMAAMSFTQSEIDTVNDWFLSEFAASEGDYEAQPIVPENIDDYMFEGISTPDSAMYLAWDASAMATAGIMGFMYPGNATFEARYRGLTGDVAVMFHENGTVYMGSLQENVKAGSSVDSYSVNGNSDPVSIVTDFGGVMSDMKIVDFVGTVYIVDSFNTSQQILGMMRSGSIIDFEKLSSYDPALYPLQADENGNYIMNVPVGEVSEGSISVPMPDSSAEHPISLDDVIGYYGSLQQFLDAGNVITLGDGTTIQGGEGIRDFTRATDVPTGYVGEGETVSDIPVIRGIVGSIKGTLEGISSKVTTGVAEIVSALSNPFDWSKKTPSGSGFISGIWGFFAVLLALLIAIMGLIAKVVIFIGQLYTIPASSAMLHPTMVQGIEWARGFNSQTGVNLYGLITGVISIVLGVVCFKLLRKIITGIGTAD